MKETTVYLIRHAEAEGNLYRRLHGHYNSNLTKNGLRQVAALEQRFETIPVDAVFSSDLARALQTAKAISVPKGLAVHKNPQLREIRLGIWEDLTFGEAERQDPEAMRLFRAASEDFCIEGAERFSECGARFAAALTQTASENAGKSIAVFTHSTALSCGLHTLFPEKTVPMCDNTAVSKLLYRDGSWEICYLNDNSHLPPEISTYVKQSWWRAATKEIPHNLWFQPYEGEIDWYLQRADEEIPVPPMAVLTFPMMGDAPAGLLQLDPQASQAEQIGKIDYFYLDKKLRGKNFGVQILGCAVSFYRNLGRRALRIEIPARYRACESYFLHYGFSAIRPGVLELPIQVRED